MPPPHPADVSRPRGADSANAVARSITDAASAPGAAVPSRPRTDSVSSRSATWRQHIELLAPHSPIMTPQPEGAAFPRDGCAWIPQLDVLRDDGVGLDLDEQCWIDQSADLEHGRGWSDGAEDFAVCLSHLPPATDVSDEHARADDVLQPGARPARRIAAIRRSASRACSAMSSPPTAPPPSAAAVVPATDTHAPTRTARE